MAILPRGSNRWSRRQASIGIMNQRQSPTLSGSKEGQSVGVPLEFAILRRLAAERSSPCPVSQHKIYSGARINARRSLSNPRCVNHSGTGSVRLFQDESLATTILFTRSTNRFCP